MKENWLDDIESRMSGYETEEPARLWDNIAEQLPHEEKRHPLVMPWWQRLPHRVYTYGAVAAALLTIVLTVSIPLFRPHEAAAPAPSVSIATTSSVPFTQSAEATALSAKPTAEPTSTEPTPPLAAHTPVIARATSVPAIHIETRHTADTLFSTQEKETITQEEEKPATEKADTATRFVIDHLEAKDAPLFADNDTPKKSNRRAFSLSVYTSGGLNASTSANYAAPVTTAVGSEGVAWEEAPLLGIMLYNQGLPTHLRYKHYMPLRAGVHLAYRFHSRLAVESGLVYSCLLSDYEDGSDSHYIAGRQTLHYIGVPLNLTCRIYSWRQLDIYGSVGGMAELCVGGTQRTDYVLNSKTEQSTNERITEHPWQFSTTLSLGAQYNCLSWLGIYLEPGATYRFSDHSSIKSIYSQRPIDFSLNLGVRFSL